MELLIKENNSYTLMKRKYHTSSKKPILTKKASSCDNSRKEATETEFDKLFAEKPRNCMEQVTLKEV